MKFDQTNGVKFVRGVLVVASEFVHGNELLEVILYKCIMFNVVFV